MKKLTILVLSVVMALCTVFGVTACSSKKYTLKFMVDGVEYHSIQTKGNEQVTLPEDPTKAGHTFAGWYFDDTTFEQEFKADSLVSNAITQDTSVYAKFTLNHVHAFTEEVVEAKFLKDAATCTTKAVYYKSCACGESGTETFETGSALGHDFGAPTYSFNADYSECTATRICQRVNTHVETETVNTVYGVTAQPTYTAVGTGIYTATFENDAFEVQTHEVDIAVKTCTVTINVNGGNAVAESTLVATCGQTLTLPTVTRTGYAFAGWKLDGEDFATTTAWSKQAETATLVAQWTANTYTVTIDVNGGNALTENTVNATYDQVLVLPTVTKTGYTFAGWKLNGEDFDTTSAWANDGDATLVAQWTAKTYTVTIDVNGGNALTDNTVDAIYDQVLVLPAVTKTGYSLVGWKLDGEDFDATKPWTNDDNATIVAQWTEKTCTITIDVNGGDELTENTVNATYGQVVAGLPTVTKTGYTFAGWKLNGEDFDTTSAWNLEDETATLVAQWTVKTYTVTIDVNGGDALANNTVNATFNVAIETLPEVTKTGYTFAGWKLNGETAFEIGDVWTTDDEDATLVAQWTAKTYTVTIDVNGGDELTDNTVDAIYDQVLVLPVVTKTGYSLVGWKLNGEDFDTTSAWNLEDETATLVAQWALKTFSLTIKDHDGTVLTEQPISVEYGGAFDIKNYVPIEDKIVVEGQDERFFSYFQIEGTEYKIGHYEEGDVTCDVDYIGTWTYDASETNLVIVLKYEATGKWY